MTNSLEPNCISVTLEYSITQDVSPLSFETAIIPRIISSLECQNVQDIAVRADREIPLEEAM